MSRFLDGRFSRLEAYAPGEQPRDKKYVKLNTNESPYPPSPKVIAAINSAEVADLRLYPDPTAVSLRTAIAGRYGLTPEQVSVGSGSDDLLNFCFMAFCGSGTGAAFPDISYGFYKVYGELYGLDCREIPLREDFTVAPEDYYGLGRTIFIANPNAPTGLALTREQLRGVIEHNRGSVVVVDEAYVDFGAESCAPLVDEYDNLIVTQTFSKSRSLAGARVGFALGSKELIADLELMKFSTNPYSVNRLSLLAGEAAMRDGGYFEKCRAAVIAERERTRSELLARGLEVLPSSANFVFARRDGTPGRELFLALRERGVLVRRWDSPRIADWLRITIGSPEDMDALIAALDDILKGA